jgi:hypothetical protein
MWNGRTANGSDSDPNSNLTAKLAKMQTEKEYETLTEEGHRLESRDIGSQTLPGLLCDSQEFSGCVTNRARH